MGVRWSWKEIPTLLVQSGIRSAKGHRSSLSSASALPKWPGPTGWHPCHAGWQLPTYAAGGCSLPQLRQQLFGLGRRLATDKGLADIGRWLSADGCAPLQQRHAACADLALHRCRHYQPRQIPACQRSLERCAAWVGLRANDGDLVEGTHQVV